MPEEQTEAVEAETAEQTTEATETTEVTETAETEETEDAEVKPTETVEFWKAQARKQEERAKANAAAAKELAELKAAQASKEEQDTEERATFERERDEAKAEALKWRVAAKHGISEEDAELFLTGTDEDALTKQAQRFNVLVPKTPGKGNVVPGAGNQPDKPPSLQEQIRLAEQSGDKALAASLKAQQLFEIAQQQ